MGQDACYFSPYRWLYYEHNLIIGNKSLMLIQVIVLFFMKTGVEIGITVNVREDNSPAIKPEEYKVFRHP